MTKAASMLGALLAAAALAQGTPTLPAPKAPGGPGGPAGAPGAMGAPGAPGAMAPPAAPSKADDEKTIYALGMLVGRSIKTFNMSKSEFETFKKGLTDMYSGAKPTVEAETFGPKIDALARSRQ